MGSLPVLGSILRSVFNYGLPIIFIIAIFLCRTRQKVVITFAVLLVLSLLNLFSFYRNNKNYETKAIKRFTGTYKLDKLNGNDCLNCKLNLLPDYSFDIIVDNKFVGVGKWNLDIDYEEVGTYLVINGGPSGVASIDETKREVEFLNQQIK